MRLAKKVFLLLVLVLTLALAGVNAWMILSTRAYVYDTVESVPSRKVGLVLGTSHRTKKGGPNPYFEKRIQTAADLYFSGKVAHFILSGDNSTLYYNEPLEMKRHSFDRVFLNRLLRWIMRDCAPWIPSYEVKRFSVRKNSLSSRSPFIVIGRFLSAGITTSMLSPW